MKFGTFRHKGLRRFYEDDDPSGMPSASVRKIRRMLTELEFAANLAQISTMPGWKLHSLHGSRRGTYALRVTGNWRLTFRMEDEIVTDLDLEDYH